ncbi:LytTR family DNA-binding domain-containing protein [Weissella bombi]|uniref:Transcriptional regulator, LytTR family n=1 Tax=Weissella bombi TaxID=1505725 RepID=A0A1C3ZLN7_9LACO|nr:LytTR family DNA-binding domain-containing protein [Weissella bombi]SCB83162.1 transcriptional regulator, LytTR family [Weissella bombi]
MKINFFIDEEQPEHIDFHVRKVTEEMKDIAATLKQSDIQIWGYRDREVVPIKIDDVVRIKTESGEVYIQTDRDIYKAKKRIYQFLELLPKKFIQISSGEIINFEFIDHLELSGNGTIKLILLNKNEAYVSRRFVAKIKRSLGI